MEINRTRTLAPRPHTDAPKPRWNGTPAAVAFVVVVVVVGGGSDVVGGTKGEHKGRRGERERKRALHVISYTLSYLHQGTKVEDAISFRFQVETVRKKTSPRDH